MTSTNEGKEVKSYQTSGPKGKTYFIELYKSLEARLSEAGTASERTKHLCEAWRRVHSLCQHSAATTHSHLLSWLQRHTAKTVLPVEWQLPERKDDRVSLEEAINVFIVESRTAAATREGASPPWEAQLVARGEWFKRILEHPWKHPVLNCLLNPDGTPPSNDEVLEWLKEERGVTFLMRLHTLVSEKCDDIAMSLASAVMERVRGDAVTVSDAEQSEEPKDKPENTTLNFGDKLREEADFTVDVFEMLTDIEFVLLHKRDSFRCIALAKRTPLRSAYQLIERLQSRLDTSPREKRLWKNAKEVAVFIAQMVIARCMVVPRCAGGARSALYCCARSLARLMPVARLATAAAALATPAVTAAHLHTLAAAVDAQKSNDASSKPFVCELYVRAITAGMNELERLKLKTEKEAEARCMEATLASWFVQLGAVLSSSARVKCECALTAFSVHPSPLMYERIKAAPPLPPIHLDVEQASTEATNPEFGSWASDSRGQTNFVKTSETLNMKARQNQANVLSTAILTEGEALGLSPELCQDLTVLLSGPRVKTLSWDMDRELLLENCRAYIERTNGGTKAVTTELKYLNLNPDDFQYLPEEDEDESNIYYGIEKGYEHLVEFQEPESTWEDTYQNVENTDLSNSSDEFDFVQPQRRRKPKKTVINSEEDDPLSLVAETKRKEKKERPHSKERSKERKKAADHEKKPSRDPLDINEGSQEKKEKPKRVRKKKPPKPTDGSLSNLVGLKVGKKLTMTHTDSDADSQGSSILPMNGYLSQDKMFRNEMRSPHSFDRGFGHNSWGNGREGTAHNVNTSGFNRLYRSPSVSGIRIASPSLSNHSRTNSPTYVSDEVKSSISKLLDFRRQKALETERRPNAIMRPDGSIEMDKINISPKAVAIPEIPKSYINKQTDKITHIKQNLDDILNHRPNAAIPSQVIQYARKNTSPNKPCQSHYSPSQFNNIQTDRMTSDRCLSTPPSADRFLDSVNLISIYGKNEPAHSRNLYKSPCPGASRDKQLNDMSQINYQDYLHEFSLNSYNQHMERKDAGKKVMRPVSRVTPVVPNIKSEHKTPQSAKQIQQKKPDGSLNTFSRLSYYKNKQTDLKKSQDMPQNPACSVASLLDGFIMNHLVQTQNSRSLTNSSKVYQDAKAKYEKICKTRAQPTHTNILQNVFTQSEKQQKPALPPKTAPTDKDHNDLLLLLRQQNLLNMHNSPIASGRAVPHNTLSSPASSSKMSTNDTYDSNPSLASSIITPNLQIDKPNETAQKVNENKIINVISTSIIKSAAPKAKDPKQRPATTKKPTQGKLKKTEGRGSKNILKPEPRKDPEEWENVMNAILKQKTPSRGPNALDVALNKSSFERAFEESLQKPTTLFIASNISEQNSMEPDFDHEALKPKEVQSLLNSPKRPLVLKNSKIKKTSMPTVASLLKQQKIDEQTIESLVQNNQVEITQHNSSITQVIIPETILKHDNKEPEKVQQRHVKMSKVTMQQNDNQSFKNSVKQNSELSKTFVKQIVDETQKKETKPVCVQMKQSTYGQKQDDPFISGIPNSDYDLLDELMDDDLRKEIGELSSDEDSYNTAALKHNKTDEKQVNVVYNNTRDRSQVPLVNNERPMCKQNDKPTQQLQNKTVVRVAITPRPVQNQLPVSLSTTNVQNNTTHVVTATTQARPLNKLASLLRSNQITVEPNVYITPAVPRVSPAQNVMLIPSNLFYEDYQSVQSPMQTVPNLAPNTYITMNNTPSINVYQANQFVAPVINTSVPVVSLTMPVVNPLTSAVSEPVVNIVPCVTTVQPKPVTVSKTQYSFSGNELPQSCLTTTKDKIAVDGNKIETKCTSSVPNVVDKDVLQKPENKIPVDDNVGKNCERKVLKEVQEKHADEMIECKRRTQKISEKDLKTQADEERVKRKRMAILNRKISYFCGIQTIPLGYSSLQLSTEKEKKEFDNADKNVKEIPIVSLQNNSQELLNDGIKSPATPDSCKENKKEALHVRRILLRSSNKLKAKLHSATTPPKPSIDKKLKSLPATSLDIPNEMPSENDQTDKETNIKQKRISKRVRNKSVVTKTKDTQVPRHKTYKITIETPKVSKKNVLRVSGKDKNSTLNQDLGTEQFFDIEAELLGSTIPKMTPIDNLKSSEISFPESGEEIVESSVFEKNRTENVIQFEKNRTENVIQENQIQNRNLSVKDTTSDVDDGARKIEVITNVYDDTSATTGVTNSAADAIVREVLTEGTAKEKSSNISDVIVKESISIHKVTPLPELIQTDKIQTNDVTTIHKANKLFSKKLSPIKLNDDESPTHQDNLPSIKITEKTQKKEFVANSSKYDNSHNKSHDCHVQAPQINVNLDKSHEVVTSHVTASTAMDGDDDIAIIEENPNIIAPLVRNETKNVQSKCTDNNFSIETITSSKHSDPLKKYVRIKLGNGKIFKGTISGSVNVDNLLDDPRIKALLMSQFEKPKKLYSLKLNVHKEVYNGNNIVTAEIHNESFPQKPLETVSLLSDDEEEDSSQVFETEYGKHKIESIDSGLFKQHQTKLKLKCFVQVKKLSIEEENSIKRRSQANTKKKVKSNTKTAQESVILDKVEIINPKSSSSPIDDRKNIVPEILSAIPSKYVQGIFNDIENILGPLNKQHVEDPVVLIDDSSSDSVDVKNKSEPKEKIDELKHMLLQDLGVENNISLVSKESTDDIQVTWASEAIDLTDDSVIELDDKRVKAQANVKEDTNTILDRKCFVRLVRCDYKEKKTHKGQQIYVEVDKSEEKIDVTPAPISRSGSFSLLENFPSLDKHRKNNAGYKSGRSSPVMEIYDLIVTLKASNQSRQKLPTAFLNCDTEWMATKKVEYLQRSIGLATEFHQTSSELLEVPKLTTLILSFIKKEDLVNKCYVLRCQSSLKRKTKPSSLPVAKISKLDEPPNEMKSNDYSSSLDLPATDASNVTIIDGSEDNMLANVTPEESVIPEDKIIINDLDIIPDLSDTDLTNMTVSANNDTSIENETELEEEREVALTERNTSPVIEIKIIDESMMVCQNDDHTFLPDIQIVSQDKLANNNTALIENVTELEDDLEVGLLTKKNTSPVIKIIDIGGANDNHTCLPDNRIVSQVTLANNDTGLIGNATELKVDREVALLTERKTSPIVNIINIDGANDNRTFLPYNQIIPDNQSQNKPANNETSVIENETELEEGREKVELLTDRTTPTVIKIIDIDEALMECHSDNNTCLVDNEIVSQDKTIITTVNVISPETIEDLIEPTGDLADNISIDCSNIDFGIKEIEEIKFIGDLTGSHTIKDRAQINDETIFVEATTSEYNIEINIENTGDQANNNDTSQSEVSFLKSRGISVDNISTTYNKPQEKEYAESISNSIKNIEVDIEETKAVSTSEKDDIDAAKEEILIEMIKSEKVLIDIFHESKVIQVSNESCGKGANEPMKQSCALISSTCQETNIKASVETQNICEYVEANLKIIEPVDTNLLGETIDDQGSENSPKLEINATLELANIFQVGFDSIVTKQERGNYAVENTITEQENKSSSNTTCFPKTDDEIVDALNVMFGEQEVVNEKVEATRHEPGKALSLSDDQDEHFNFNNLQKRSFDDDKKHIQLSKSTEKNLIVDSIPKTENRKLNNEDTDESSLKTDEIFDALKKIFGEEDMDDSEVVITENPNSTAPSEISKIANEPHDVINTSLREDISLIKDLESDTVVENIVEMLGDDIIDDITIAALEFSSGKNIEKERKCKDNSASREDVLQILDQYRESDGDLEIKGIEFKDPVMGTRYVFSVIKEVSDINEESDGLNNSHDNEADSPLNKSEENVVNDCKHDDEIEDIGLVIPKHTYMNNSLVRRSSRNMKRKKDMSDIKTTERKYRKGKNIDCSKITASTIAELAYAKQYKCLLDYCSTIKFSYARPFHIDNIDVGDMLKAWPITKSPAIEVNDSDGREVFLFKDFDDAENAIAVTDPLMQTLSDEIENGEKISDYKSCDINEINFNMGFGERSGRVIQKIETGITKVSAATLSDVKQYQPFSMSDVRKAYPCITQELDALMVKLSHANSLIKLKEKVRSFFEKSAAELNNEWLHDKKYTSNDCHLSKFPFGLTSSEFMEVPDVETIVNVVQVGQLPVTAAAQNLVTCDPRVTHVSDASPSQCSDNSPDADSQAAAETEYTELTTANITLPLVHEYTQNRFQSSPSQDQNVPGADSAMNESAHTLSIVKIELMEEEASQERLDSEIYENDFSPLPNSNVEYSFEDTSNTLFNSSVNLNTSTSKNNLFNSSNSMDNTFNNIFSNTTNVDNTYMVNTPSSSESTYTNLDNYSPSPNMGNSSTEMDTTASMNDASPIMDNSHGENTPMNMDDASTNIDNTYTNIYNPMSDSNDMSNTSVANTASNMNDSPINLENRPMDVNGMPNVENVNMDNTNYDYTYENIEDYATNIEDNNNAENFPTDVDNYANVENYSSNVNDYTSNMENYAAGDENYTSSVENFARNVENYAANIDNYSTNTDSDHTNVDTPAANILEEPQDLSMTNSTQESKIYNKCKENNSSKINQIEHAMNAAGISSESVITSGPDEIANLVGQSAQVTANNYSKSTAINVMTLQQALAQVLPPPLNQTSTPENQMPNNPVTQQVLHIVQGNNAQTVINKPNGTHVLHIVQNKNNPATNGLSLVDTGLQQGGNQLIHIVNNGNQNNAQFLKRVNLLTNLTNAQGSNEQKMIQFVCKSADGKAIQLNAGHQRSMVLRLHPTAVPTTPKPTEPQDLSAPATPANSASNDDLSQEIKSRSVYEENYAQFIQNAGPVPGPSSTSTSPCQEKSTSLPKFNQVFGKLSYQENQNEINHNGLQENSECPAEENTSHLEQTPEVNNPPLLVRNTPPETTQPQPSPVQQIKQTISPMNLHTTMHGGVIYTRQIPVNIGGGQTINLITVPSTELVDESPQKQQAGAPFANQEGEHSSIIKLVPHHNPSNPNAPTEENNTQPSTSNETNRTTQSQPQSQPVLTQMRIKLPMLSKGSHIVPGARLVRPSFFQIQRNVIAGTNQPVYQQLVLTTAPSLGQTIRLPNQAQSPQTQPILVQTSQHPQSSPHIPVQQVQHAPSSQHLSAQQAHSAPPTPQTQSVPKLTKTDTEPDSELSTLTLEQLREFDMVLEQVKERSVQPTPSTTPVLKPTPADSTDGAPRSSTSVSESTQQVYSVENNQPKNVVSYVNRKSTITSATTSFVRSPDSSGIVDTPSSSTQVQITHTVTSKSSTAEGAPAVVPHPKKKKKKRPSSSSSTLASLGSPSKTNILKPQEDEQTTQRILYILAEYKEQVENSPDKNKPAPRRRNQFPPTVGSKRKRHCSSRATCRREGVEMSPMHGEHGELADDLITLGSEDSSSTFSECNDCMESNSPEDTTKVVSSVTFEHETTTQITQSVPPRNVIVGDRQTITVARTTTATATAKPTTTTVLMPANYLLPVSMLKGGQQIAIMTNRGPKILVGAGDTNAGALLFQRLIGPGLKPVLARPGVRHIRLPTTALHNLQAFNIQTTPVTQVQPPDSTAPQAPTPAPPDLVDTRAMSSPWQDREAQDKPERGPSPDCTEPWNMPSSSIADDYGYEEIVRTDNMERTVLVVQQRKDGRHHRLTHVSTAALRHKYAILEHELRLQKSLSEECEDLGVDSPSASDLFPEADILFGAPSPAHEQTIDQCNTPPPIPMPTIQPDLDDQIATDQLLTHNENRSDDIDLNLDDVGEIVTVGEDGIATIPTINAEEFARSHPNTTFHTEPEDEIPPFTIAQSIKGRHITFHANRVPGTVVMAPQTTVISQATVNSNDAHNTVKFIDIDNMINSMPCPQPVNVQSVLVKDPGTSKSSKFDSLKDSHSGHKTSSKLESGTSSHKSNSKYETLKESGSSTHKYSSKFDSLREPSTSHRSSSKFDSLKESGTRSYSKFDSLKETGNLAPKPLSKFDSLLTDSKAHQGNSARAAHSTGHGTQVIRRLRHDERTNTRTNNKFHFEEPRRRTSITDEVKMRNDRAMVESMGDNASSPGQPELFWDSTTTDRHERKFQFNESEKVTKSPFDELLNDSSAYGPHTRLDSVIKAARPERTYERTSFEGISVSGSDESRPLRTYPPKRVHTQHTQDTERHFTMKTTTTTTHHHETTKTTHHHDPDRSKRSAPRCQESEGRRRTGRGLVKRNCSCCSNGSSAPPKKRSRPKKPQAHDFVPMSKSDTHTA